MNCKKIGYKRPNLGVYTRHDSRNSVVFKGKENGSTKITDETWKLDKSADLPQRNSESKGILMGATQFFKRQIVKPKISLGRRQPGLNVDLIFPKRESQNEYDRNAVQGN